MRLLPAILALGLMANAAVAQQVPAQLREKLVQSLEVASGGQLQIVAIKSTPLTEIYEVELNTGELLYSDRSGDYLFAGDMYQTTNDGLLNLSSATRQVRNAEKIAAIDEQEMIIFTPDNTTRATITVFTDVDCTYCRALHRDMETLLDLGVEVRYLAYPRGGEQASSFAKMNSVWCADDRKKSLTQAKNGQNLPVRECDNPIMAHYALGNELGISGTPAIVFPNGQLIPGYLDADRLAEMLQLD
ncbi:MAG: DsbC family protein [Pseudomonadales bacterium]|nr:DsbC family protein [Pseudomonadales bacterium]